MARLKAVEHPNVCSAYWDAWDLFDDRDDVMHGARTTFTELALGWHEVNMDAAILTLLAWAARTGATDLAELDDELDEFVKRGVTRWDTGVLHRPRWMPPARGRAAGDTAPRGRMGADRTE
jgi:hypothetical protein